MKIRVTTITCPKCQDELYSRTTHDMRYCSCGEVAVDGGQNYTKVAFKKDFPKRKTRYVKASRQELYDDWDKRIDKFGRIDNTK